MSATRVYWVHCDGKSCRLNEEASGGEGSMCVGPNSTLAEYRARLARDGWKSRGSKDYCPDCAETRTSVPTPESQVKP